MNYASEAQAAIESVVGDVGTVLFTGLTTVLGIIGVLIGLFFLIRLVRNWVGGTR